MVIGVEAARANKKEKTGTEWYAHSIIRSMVAIDHDDRFLLYTDSPLDDSLSQCGPNVHERILRWPPRRLWNQARLSFEMLFHKPDVLFLPAHTLPIIHPRSTVTMIHDVGFDRFPALYHPKELAYHRWAVRYALRHAQAILVPSSFTKKELCALYPSAHKRESDIKVIHHGFDSEVYKKNISQETTNTILRNYGIRQPFLLFVGRLQEKKNVPRIAEAFVHFIRRRTDTHAQLVLAGQPDYGYDRIQQIIQKSGCTKSVCFPGYIKKEHLVTIMKAAHVFVFPSLYEGFGFPILEAQASDVPVLSSTTSSLPEIGGEGAWYVNPHDTEALSDGIERCFSDTSVRNALLQNGRNNLLRFRWDECAKKTLAVLQRAP